MTYVYDPIVNEAENLVRSCMWRGFSAEKLKKLIAELWQEVHEEEGARGRKELEK